MPILSPAARFVVHSLVMFAALFAFTMSTGFEQAACATQPAKQNEPMHEGKTISQWAALLNSKNVKDYQRAVDALSQLASQSNDAVPELVKALYVSDHVNDFERIVVPALVRIGKPVVPALRDELKQINTVITKPPQGVDPKKSGTLVITQVHRYTAIMHALRKLGTEADEAADEVRRFYEKSKTTSTRNVARDTLNAIQPTALTYIRRGTEAYTKGEYEKAVDLLSKAINMDKSNPTAKNQKQQKSRTFHLRAAAYAKLEKHDLAIADLNEAIRLDPTKASLYQHRAKVYDDKGDKKLADADRAEIARLQNKTAQPPLPSIKTPIPSPPAPAIKPVETATTRIDYARQVAPHVVNSTSRTEFLKQYPNAKTITANLKENFFEYQVVGNQGTILYVFIGETILGAKRINANAVIVKSNDLSFKLLNEIQKKLGTPDDTEVTEAQKDAGIFMCRVWFMPEEQIMIIGSLIELELGQPLSLMTEVVNCKNAASIKK